MGCQKLDPASLGVTPDTGVNLGVEIEEGGKVGRELGDASQVADSCGDALTDEGNSGPTGEAKDGREGGTRNRHLSMQREIGSNEMGYASID